MVFLLIVNIIITLEAVFKVQFGREMLHHLGVRRSGDGADIRNGRYGCTDIQTCIRERAGSGG